MEMHIDLPEDLGFKIQHAAELRGISLAEYVRASLERAVINEGSDALFEDTAVFDGDAAQDVAAHHDKYLYGDDS